MPSSPLPRWILNVSGATVIGFNGEEEIKVGANQRRLNCQLPKMKERPGGWGGGQGDMECGCASGGPCAADARGGEAAGASTAADALLPRSARRGLEPTWGQASAWAPSPSFRDHCSITVNISRLGNFTTCHKFPFFSRNLNWSIQNNFASNKSLGVQVCFHTGMYLQTCMQVQPCK